MNFTQEQQEKFIRLAMDQAQLAIDAGSSPFGVVMVDQEGTVVLSAFNTTSKEDVLAHAEINLIRDAAKEMDMRDLSPYAFFINAASCTMCAAALIRSGAKNFYYGAPFEPHTNPAATFEHLQEFSQKSLNIHGGILEDVCIQQITKARLEKVAR